MLYSLYSKLVPGYLGLQWYNNFTDLAVGSRSWSSNCNAYIPTTSKKTFGVIAGEKKQLEKLSA